MVSKENLLDFYIKVHYLGNDTPSDLDSHLTYYVDGEQECHVYYSHKVATYNGETLAQLDLDDVTSYGPETVTITLDASLLENGSEFKYSVHDYTNRYAEDSKEMSLSGATVCVYAGNDMISVYNVPVDVVGTVWHVFDITQDGIRSVNEFEIVQPMEGPDVVANYEAWYGLYYDKDGKIQSIMLHERDGHGDHYADDERANEIYEWYNSTFQK